MRFIFEIGLLLLALLGQLALTVSLVNRIHAVFLSRPLKVVLAGSCWFTLLLVPVWMFPLGGATATSLVQTGTLWPLLYLVPLWGLGLYVIARRIYCVVTRPDLHPVLISNHTQTLHLEKLLGRSATSDRITALIASLPGNQFLQLHVHEKTIELPRTLPALNGLSIAHMTDLHMNGRLDKSFYQELARQTNALESDLIVITGDLFDEDSCLDWIPETLGTLQARAGVYFILGNHDLRVDDARARRLLCEAGLIDLGGRCKEITIEGQPILLAGNELPWFEPAADMSRHRKTDQQDRVARILLSHAPDQIHWARSADFDLMLAGHTHGGQVRFPVIGPILSPSRMGIRYSAGTFYCEPTVLHVSRGISSLTPLRYNCPPELALLRLQCAETSAPDEEETRELALASGT